MIRIYLVTNTVNGKKYVGQTSQKVSKRWTNHCSVANKRASSYFSNAIRKNGRNNFTVETVAEIETREWSDYLESMWILCLGTFDPKVGYNLTTGGNRHKHIAPSAVAKVRQKRVGFRHSEESKQQLSETLKLAYAEGRFKGNKGTKASEATKAKLSVLHTGEKHWNYQDGVSTDEIVRLRLSGMSMQDVAKHLGISISLVEGRSAKSGVKFPRRNNWTPEARKKVSLANTGRKYPPEFGAKISKIVTETWAKRKQNELTLQSGSAQV